jgi:hypothetical protein
MIFSAQQIFSDDQAVTATAISTNVIDLGVRGTPFDAKAPLIGDTGKGNPVCILIQVTTDFAVLTSLTVTLETSANADLSSSTVLATEVILVAALVAGKQTFMQYLPNGVTGRYLGIRYTVGGSDATLGNITAGITMGNQTNVHGA